MQVTHVADSFYRCVERIAENYTKSGAGIARRMKRRYA